MISKKKIQESLGNNLFFFFFFFLGGWGEEGDKSLGNKWPNGLIFYE